MNEKIRIALLDNGSVRASSTKRLRALASSLGERLGRRIDAVSLMHANRIDPAELGGEPGVVWAAYLERLATQGDRTLGVVPLFFGPSVSLVKRAPQLAAKHVGLETRFAPPLVNLNDSDDRGLAKAMAALAARTLLEWKAGGDLPLALLVDHGSPSAEVARVRDAMAAQLACLLKGRVSDVLACSMERRKGERYAFSDPLLADALEKAANQSRRLLICPMFLFPGRHAGAGGDVERIVEASPWGQQPDDWRMAPLASESERLLDLLETRARGLLESGRKAN